MEKFVPEVPMFIDSTLVASSLGFDCSTVCAAMRAGINRPNPLHGFSVTAEDGEETDVSGFPIPLLTNGFEGAGRYRRLLDQIFRKIALKMTESKDSKYYLLAAVPNEKRYGEGLSLESGSPLAENQNVFTLNGDSWGSIVENALEVAGIADEFVATKVVRVSTADSPTLLRMSHEALKRDPSATIVVVTVDSLVDTSGLTWLYHTGRLKTAEHPAGAMPGECVNSIFLSSRKTAKSSLKVESVTYEEEPHDLFHEKPPLGRGLANLLMEYTKTAQGEQPWFILNLTGEQKPSYEWAMALVHYQSSAGEQLNESLWLPNIQVGEIGISFMSLAISWVRQSIKRGYSVSARCGIPILDHSGKRTLVALASG